MSIRSRELGATSARPLAARRAAAIVAQALSFLTTLAAGAHLIQPASTQTWAMTVIGALVAEGLLIALKELLYDPTTANDVLGWAGFVGDAVINTGGILPFAARLLTFGPIAAILMLIGVNPSDPLANAIGSVLISALLGTLLSVAPHRLWRAARGRRRNEE